MSIVVQHFYRELATYGRQKAIAIGRGNGVGKRLSQSQDGHVRILHRITNGQTGGSIAKRHRAAGSHVRRPVEAGLQGVEPNHPGGVVVGAGGHGRLCPQGVLAILIQAVVGVASRNRAGAAVGREIGQRHRALQQLADEQPGIEARVDRVGWHYDNRLQVRERIPIGVLVLEQDVIVGCVIGIQVPAQGINRRPNDQGVFVVGVKAGLCRIIVVIKTRRGPRSRNDEALAGILPSDDQRGWGQWIHQSVGVHLPRELERLMQKGSSKGVRPPNLEGGVGWNGVDGNNPLLRGVDRGVVSSSAPNHTTRDFGCRGQVELRPQGRTAIISRVKPEAGVRKHKQQRLAR